MAAGNMELERGRGRVEEAKRLRGQLLGKDHKGVCMT